MSYLTIEGCKEKLPYFHRKCDEESCNTGVCIGVSAFYCFEHSGKEKKFLKFPYRNVIIVPDQERMY